MIYGCRGLVGYNAMGTSPTNPIPRQGLVKMEAAVRVCPATHYLAAREGK